MRLFEIRYNDDWYPAEGNTPEDAVREWRASMNKDSYRLETEKSVKEPICVYIREHIIPGNPTDSFTVTV